MWSSHLIIGFSLNIAETKQKDFGLECLYVMDIHKIVWVQTLKTCVHTVGIHATHSTLLDFKEEWLELAIALMQHLIWS